MALNLETLSVTLRLASGAFTNGMSQAEKRLTGFQKKLSSVGESVTNFGQKMTTFVTLPIIGVGVAVVNWAADLDESINKTNVLFGDSADEIMAWSETSDKAMGTSQQAALDYASAFAGMLKPLASTSDELAGMSMEMTQLTADFGSFHNLNPEESFTVIQSALAGETEAIRRYGVDVSAAAVNEYAWANGIAARGEELTEDQKLLARYGIILEETTSAQGDFGNTAHSTSNRLKTLRGTIQNVGAGFGRLLLPFVNRGAEALQSMLRWLDKLDPSMKMWIVGLVAAAAAIGPLAIGLGFLISGFGTLAGVIAFFLSPIGLIIAAVALLAYIFRDELGAAIGWIVGKFQELKAVFDEYLAISGDPMLAALGALQKVFPQLTAVIAPLRDMVFNLRDAFQAFKDGNYGAAFSSLALAAGNLWDATWTALSSIDWWGLATAVAGWLGTQIGLIPWSEYITDLGTFGADLQTRFESAISTGVDWNGLGVKIGEKVAALAPIVGEKAVELVEEFARWIGDPAGWGQVALAFGAGLMLLPGSIATYIGGLMVQPAMDLLMGFVEGLDLNWVLVAFWFSTMGPRVLTAIGSMVDTLTVKGIDLIMGLLTGAQNTWTGSVQPYLHGRAGQAFTSIGNLSSTLSSKGLDLIEGLLTGARNHWLGSVQPYLHQRGAQAFASIGSLVTTLLSKGSDLINGMYAGMLSKWNDARTWLSGIPGRASSAVGSLGGILTSAGASLVQGLIDGIRSKFDALRATLGELTGLIPDWKGPPKRDAKLLFGNGLLIMQGLGRGMDRGWDQVTRQLSGYTSQVGGEFGSGVGVDVSGGSDGQRPIVQIITLEPGKWAEFLANAEAGGSFARQFGGEVAMREGVA